MREVRQAPSMEDPRFTSSRFGAGLTELEVRRFQTILREDCGIDLPMPEAWGRAIELLTLVEMLLERRGVLEKTGEEPNRVRAPSLLTHSRS